jgi:hypothetical protein
MPLENLRPGPVAPLPVSEPPSSSQIKCEAGALMLTEGADCAGAAAVVARAV